MESPLAISQKSLLSQGIANKVSSATHDPLLPHTSLLESRGLRIPTRSSQGHLVTCRVMETAHVGPTMQQTPRLKIPLIPCRISHRTAPL